MSNNIRPELNQGMNVQEQLATQSTLISRRTFLGVGLGGAVSLLATACGYEVRSPIALAPTPTTTTPASPAEARPVAVVAPEANKQVAPAQPKVDAQPTVVSKPAVIEAPATLEGKPKREDISLYSKKDNLQNPSKPWTLVLPADQVAYVKGDIRVVRKDGRVIKLHDETRQVGAYSRIDKGSEAVTIEAEWGADVTLWVEGGKEAEQEKKSSIKLMLEGGCSDENGDGVNDGCKAIEEYHCDRSGRKVAKVWRTQDVQ